MNDLNEPIIQRGYVLMSRKLLTSGIMQKPPLYFKIWGWLILQAQHKDFKNLKRGQLWTSMPIIQDAMTYKIGYRTVRPTIKEIRGVLDYLRNPDEGHNEGQDKGTMIVTTKGTHGMLVTIQNYDLYQTPENYEGHNEGRNEIPTKVQRRAGQGHNINKNVKNDNNVQEINNNNILFFNDWLRAKDKLELRMEPHAYKTWIKNIKPISINKNMLQLATPGELSKRVLEEKFIPEILSSMRELRQDIDQIQIVIEN